MLKKVWLPLFCVLFLFAGSAGAQEDAPPGMVSLTSGRYVSVITHTALLGKAGTFVPSGGVDKCGSGFRIGGQYVLTNAHTMAASDVLQVGGEPIEIVSAVSPAADLMLVKLPSARPVPWIKIADPKVGQTIWDMTNSDCKDGLFDFNYVMKVEGSHLYLKWATIPGASGSGFVDRDGDLVGFTDANMWVNNEGPNTQVPYTVAIPASIVRGFLRKVLPPEDLAKMGIATTEPHGGGSKETGLKETGTKRDGR